MLQYRNHLYVIIITRFRNQASSFNFSSIGKNIVLKEIGCLSTTMTSQDTDLPVIVLKENADYFAEFICTEFNESVRSSQSPNSFKYVNITPIFKNESRNHNIKMK